MFGFYGKFGVIMALYRKSKKKPSAGLSAKEKSATVKAARAGKDIGKKGKMFSKIATDAAKRYGVVGSILWKHKAKGR